ncbi:MAG: hypothetical protein KGJ77_00030 [Acidobacteriota bacterium]|nr:hypothetical protein [Acidobacteriota bacterium]
MSVLVVPILLLAAPGRAVSDARTGNRPGAAGSPRAGHGAGPERARAHAAPSWADRLVVAADPIAATSTTTTTTTAPPDPVPAVHVAAVTTLPPTTAPPTTTTTAPPPPAHVETGQASWYQAPAGTCASPDIAYGTVVSVTDLATGGSVTCTVDDRMAASTGRVLDLSEATFSRLADPSAGVIEVRVSW